MGHVFLLSPVAIGMPIVVNVYSHFLQYLFEVLRMSQTIYDVILGFFNQNATQQISQPLHDFFELDVLALNGTLIVIEYDTAAELLLEPFDLLLEGCFEDEDFEFCKLISMAARVVDPGLKAIVATFA